MAEAGVESQRPRVVYEVRLHGGIDISRKAQLMTLVHDFEQGAATDALVDLSDVPFIDSTGLGFVAGLTRRCNKRGGRLTVTGARGVVRRAFHITGLDRVCDLADERSNQ